MTRLNCEETRTNDVHPPLSIEQMLSDPVEQFITWYHDAQAAGEKEPNAMVLSTRDTTLIDSRVVLLKKIEDNGFVFYTNYHSSKAKQIERHQHIGALFYWQLMGRQVRIQGIAEKISASASEAYFLSRPRPSQIAVYASHQSDVIQEDTLSPAFTAWEEKFLNQPVPYPAFWGGYTIQPTAFEFFQSQAGRLHDRFHYLPLFEKNTWKIERLSP